MSLWRKSRAATGANRSPSIPSTSSATDCWLMTTATSLSRWGQGTYIKWLNKSPTDVFYASVLKNTGEDMNYRTLERIVRGYSNHRRIQMLELLNKTPELSVEEVASTLRINYKTAAEHIRRLAISAMVVKRNAGNAVRLKVSKRGDSILKFLRTLE